MARRHIKLGQEKVARQGQASYRTARDISLGRIIQANEPEVAFHEHPESREVIFVHPRERMRVEAAKPSKSEASTSRVSGPTPGLAADRPDLVRSYLQAEHQQRLEYARIEHERRMEVIEAEAALVGSRRLLSSRKVVPNGGHLGTMDVEVSPPAGLETIRAALTRHLGTPEAADAWLDSEDTGYPTTAMDAIQAGKADLVMADLEQQWGPSPSYA